jgi:hypothetical protein
MMANGKSTEHEKRKIIDPPQYCGRSLDVVGSLLTDKHIPYLRVDGTIPSAKRREVLEKFQKQEDIPVLLMTLGTGAVGYDAYLLVIPKR